MCKFRIKISGYQGPTFAQNEKNLGTLAPSVFKIRLTGYSVVVTSNRTCISREDSYLVERLHSRKVTDRENLFTMRIQGVPLGLANLSFSAKSSHGSPCGFPTTGQCCSYRLKWWGVSHSLPGNVSRAGNMPQNSSKGSSHFYCLLGNLFPSLSLGKISGIPHSPRTSQPTDHATFIVSWILLCSAGTIRISNVPTGSWFEC